MKKQSFTLTIFILAMVVSGLAQDSEAPLDYKLLATTKTSTMQKELNETSVLGYRVLAGAPTSGSEMVLFLSLDGTASEPYKYKLLATSRTGTMQKELNESAVLGYRLIPSTIIAKKSLFGGEEIVVIMELVPNATKQYEYRLLATNRTRTLQKEARQAKDDGFVIVGMVSRGEHMVIMERESDLP
ncbi:MAG: hypothetical protein OEM82_10125 [Acidobacteriota bacterium]|nr:hypothetical protein [Acidobacteriota bacterium]MDH3531157.1 hypothetical protein [Acidobacteriota bacterium]